MRKAIVLGGSRGIGKAASKSLSLIDDVVVYSYDSKQCDTGNIGHIQSLCDEHREVDILVLNTGGPPSKNFFDIKTEEWNKYHNQLFLGFCRLLQIIKVRDDGFVFLISSFNIKEPNPNLVLSNSYRIALVSVIKSLSKIMASRRVSFVNIAPGPIKTERLSSLVDDLDSFEKSLPMGYAANASEIGDFISSIVENNTKYLSGVTINFDGAAGNSLL